MPRLIVIPYVLALSMLVFAACNDDGNGTGTETPARTPATTQTDPTPAGTDVPQPTSVVGIQTSENTIALGRDPVSAPPATNEQVSLILATSGTPDVEPSAPAIDRMAFRFEGGLPGYDIRYVPGPILGCGSGDDQQMTGAAFLQIRMEPATTHDEQGNPTVSPVDTQPGLLVLQQAKQTCDVEGVVTWTLGLSSEVDFRVNTYAGGLLVVDVKHP